CRHTSLSLFPYTTLFRSSEISDIVPGTSTDVPSAPSTETSQETLDKYGITESNLTQKYTEFPEGTKIDFKTGGGTEASFIKKSEDRKSTRLNSSHVKISY